MARETNRSFYVYVLFRENGTPFYVGKGKRDRMTSHFAPNAERCRVRNRYKTNIIRQMTDTGLDIPRVKVAQNISEDEAFDIERAFILAIGRFPDGPLVNMSDGGEGHSGRKNSDAHKAALLRGKQNQVLSPESRARLSAAAKARDPTRLGAKLTAEHKERLRLSNIGNKHSQGRVLSEETKAKIRAKAIGRKPSEACVEARKLQAARAREMKNGIIASASTDRATPIRQKRRY